MIEEHPINLKNNFILGWYDKTSTTLFDELIEYHRISEHKFPGYSSINGANNLHKNSVDCKLDLKEDLSFRYLTYLQKNIDLYVNKYTFCNSGGAWSIVENPLIQYYPSNGGFYSWHTERNGGTFPFCNRHLVFMTYLNDIEQDGETEFYYQKEKIKPKKGLTLVWPSDWTFTHRGIPTKEEKYIITGWFGYTS